MGLSACDTSGKTEKDSLPGAGQKEAPKLQLRDGPKATKKASSSSADSKTAKVSTKHDPVTISKDGQSFIGTLTPSAIVKIPAKQTATIAEMKAVAGQYVKKGAVLFRQDTTMAQLQLVQGEKSLELAKIQARAAQRELNRAQKLVSGGATAQVRLDGARTQAELATAGVAQAQAAIALARQQVQEGTMRAPRSGIITQKRMEKGELATMMPPSVVYVLEAHDPIEVQVSVPIPALKAIKPGQSAQLHVSELGVRKEATVKRISDHVDPRTRSAQIILQAENKDRALKPGMYVDIRLTQSTSK